MQAIVSMNLPKFVTEDIPLFNALVKDLFPTIEPVEFENPELTSAVEQAYKELGYVVKKEQVAKIIQLFDSKNTRHGNMLVGRTLTGKSTCWKVLHKAMNILNARNPAVNPAVKYEVLNPKTISLNELFGCVDQNTMEWNEGVLSSMMARLCKG
jgi:dynein heavy chain